MDVDTNLINNRKNSSDFSDYEERSLLVPTPTSSFVGHEKYIDTLLDNFPNNSYNDYFEKINLDIIFDDHKYIPFNSKNDKIKITNNNTTDDPAFSVEMENSFIERYKNRKQKYSQSNRPSTSTTTTVESRKPRGAIMVDRPAAAPSPTTPPPLPDHNLMNSLVSISYCYVNI